MSRGMLVSQLSHGEKIKMLQFVAFFFISTVCWVTYWVFPPWLSQATNEQLAKSLTCKPSLVSTQELFPGYHWRLDLLSNDCLLPFSSPIFQCVPPHKMSGKGWGREQRWLIWETTSYWWQFWYLFLIVVAAIPPPTRQATGLLDMHEFIHWRVLRRPFSAQSLVWQKSFSLAPCTHLTSPFLWQIQPTDFLEIGISCPFWRYLQEGLCPTISSGIHTMEGNPNISANKMVRNSNVPAIPSPS